MQFRSTSRGIVAMLCLWLSGAVTLGPTGCGDDSDEPDAGGPIDIGLSDGVPADGAAADRDAAPLDTIDIETSALSLRVEVDPFAFELRNAEGQLVLATLSEPVRVPADGAENAYGPPAATWTTSSYATTERAGWDGYEGTDEPWTRFDQTISASLEGGVIQLALGAEEDPEASLDVSLWADEARLHVELSLAAGADQFNRLGQSFALGSEEAFFGLGARPTTVDHRGESYYCWVEEAGTGQGEGHPPGPENPAPNGGSMTPFPVPFVMSSAGYGLWVDSAARSTFHLGAHADDLWRLEVADTTVSYTIYVGNPVRQLADFTADVGRPSIPPLWAFGPRRRVDVDEDVLDMPEWRALRELDVAITAIEDDVAPLPRATDRGRETALEARVETLHQWGFNVLGQISPLVSAEDESVARDYEQATARGYLATDDSGDPYLVELATEAGAPEQMALVDLTNRGASRWFQSQLRRLLDLGYDGCVLRHGEQVPHDAQFFDGRSGLTVHNDYPVLAQTAIDELFDEERAETGYFASDSGFAGSASVLPAAYWSRANTGFGDAGGLPAAVRAGINLGLSGVPYYGSAIGGTDATTDPPPDRELYLRWVEFGALSPVMVEDEVTSGLDSGESRWSLWSDAETLEVYARYARLHTRLGPYLQGLAQIAAETGVPLMRHPWLHHPRDVELYEVDDEYYLGPSLLVAPVVERGALTRAVYFPDESYLDWHTGELHRGPGWAVVEAPLERIPLFLVEGGLVPLLDSRVDTLASDSLDHVIGIDDVADVLDVRGLQVAGVSTFALADGTTLEVEVTDHAQGPFRVGETELTAVDSDAELAECDGCYRLQDGPLAVLEVTTPLGENIEVTGTGISLRAVHPRSHPRRVRWQLYLAEPAEPSDE